MPLRDGYHDLMKLRQHPDDFRVEEVSTVESCPEGPFALYRLEKTGWTTPDALAAIRRRWKVDFQRMSYAGLKDRHAHTIQYLRIHNGPEKNLSHSGFTVTYIGRLSHAYKSEHVRTNRFQVTIRSLSLEDANRAEEALPEVTELGVPNYFDDQRFG